MIRNDRQYAIIRSRAERLEGVLGGLTENPQEGVDDVVVALQIRTVRGELEQMRAELGDYEELKAGRAEVGTPATVADLPRVLIRARIAAGLTQAQLAHRLGLKAQQIQRYESTDYESASLERLREVAEALDVRLAPPPVDDAVAASHLPDLPHLIRRLSAAGLPAEFVKRRLLPRGFDDNELSVVEVLTRVARVFGWTPRELLHGQPALPILVPSFKKPKNAEEKRTVAVTAWADHLVSLTLRATHDLKPGGLPPDPISLHRKLVSEYSGVTLSSVVGCLWDHGIPVIPLAEAGGFHAARFRRSGRDVIVLGHGLRRDSIWLFDALHEAGHVVEPEAGDTLIVETDPGAGASDDAGEAAANAYAAAVAFGGLADTLLNEVMRAARGQTPRVKRAVHLIARKHGIDQGLLAFHVAHDLATRGVNWWGAAQNLQPEGSDPWQAVRDEYIQRIDWDALGTLDRGLLMQALEPDDLDADPPVSGGRA